MNAKRYFLILAAGGLMIWTANVQAQSVTTQAASSVPAVVPTYSAPYYYHGGHASTPGEGLFLGLGGMIRSIGEANYYNSLAARNYEVMRSQFMENRTRALQLHYEMRRLNESYRASKRRPPPTGEQLARWAEKALPARLSERELDPITRTIHWPSLLVMENFAPYREELQRLFSEQSPTQSGLGTENYRQARKVAQEMQNELQAMIREANTAEYIAASKFLKSLAREAKFPAVLPTVAAK